MRILIVLCLARILTAACSTQPQYTPPEIVVTRDSSDACGPREVAEIIAAFTDAFNRGDQDELVSFFFGTTRYKGAVPANWYSLDDANPSAGVDHFVVYGYQGVDELLAYFARRHRQHERIRPVEVLTTYTGPTYAGFAPTFERRADDIDAGSRRFTSGKGEINCAERRFVVMSLGGLYGPNTKSCPMPAGGASKNTFVACSSEEHSSKNGRR